ncbi:MAG TPA: hypothetical protein V6D22_05630 [Candidatus Obscuribacterales bacterium]
MNQSWQESPVSLEKLDGHLKALLRLKIREFVHLSPWFKDEPLLDRSLLSTRASSGSTASGRTTTAVLLQEESCPHKKPSARIGRRYTRSSLHLSGII